MDSVSPSPEPFGATGNTNTSTNTNTEYTWSGTSISTEDATTPRASSFHGRHGIAPSPSSSDSHSKNTHSGASTPSNGNSRLNYDFSLPIFTDHNTEPNADFLTLKAELEAGPQAEDTLKGFDQSLQIGQMMLVLSEAESALKKGDADTGEEKTQAGLEIALELGDRDFIERCQVFMDWVKSIRDEKDWGDVDPEEDAASRDEGSRLLLEDGRKEDGNENEGNRTPRSMDDVEGNEGEPPTDEDTSRKPSPTRQGPSTSPGAREAEFPGDFLEEGLQEAQWQFADDEQSEAATEDAASDAQDDMSDEDDWAILRDCDPSNRPQTPIPARSPSPDDDDDDELTPTQSSSSINPQHARRQSIERYNSSQSYNDASDQNPGLHRHSHIHSPSASQPYQYISDSESDSGNEEEDHLDIDQALASDQWTDSSSDEDEPLEHNIVRKRRMPSIADTTLSYTYLHKHKRSNNSNSKSRPRKRRYPWYEHANPSTSTSTTLPKSWYTPSSAADTHHPSSPTPDPTLFYNAHNATLLLRFPASDSDTNSLTWLTNYNASPVRPSKSKFTFRKRLPVSQMASRVRSTRLFPEQDWEFIPLKADWDAFVREGREKVSMAFLAWERERVGDLVRAKKRRWGGCGWIGLSYGSDWSLGWTSGFSLDGDGDGNGLLWGVGLGILVMFLLLFLFVVFRLRS
ncbi:hypothetical protein BDV06DRAFT_218736 [Aspergillus oleicola]